MKVKALVRHWYSGKYRNPDEVYNCSKRFFPALRALGKVEAYSEPKESPKPAPKAPAKAPVRRRTYQRKDLTAEES